MATPWSDIKFVSARNHQRIETIDNAIQSFTTSTTTHIKNFLNNQTVKQYIKLGTGIASAIEPFTDKPTAWNCAKSIFLCCQSLADSVEICSYDFFDENIWTNPFPHDFTTTVMEVLRVFPHELIKTETSGYNIIIVTIPKIGKVGWTANKWRKPDKIFVECENSPKITAFVKTLLWEKHKNNALVLSRNAVLTPNEDRLTLKIDEINDTHESEMATTISKNLSRAFEVNESRSLMLYGPPGTGKSTLARTIIKTLNLRSFRLRVEDIELLEPTTIFEIVNTFKPDAIILDDFDRCRNSELLLEAIEYFHRNVKLVIATVNDQNRLSQALLRPGRFDELIVVDKMDDAVIRTILGPENEELFNDVHEWPVSFIHELNKRCKFMSKNDAVASITELAKRVNKLRNKFDSERDEIAKIHSVITNTTDDDSEYEDDE